MGLGYFSMGLGYFFVLTPLLFTGSFQFFWGWKAFKQMEWFLHKKGKKVIVIQPFCQHFRNTIEKLFVLWELVNTDVVHFHGDGEGGFIDAFLTAPVAAPG